MDSSLGELPNAPKPRLLIVEDASILWGYLKEVLSSDYEVEVAQSGLKAWEAIQTRPFDLVVSDIFMPGGLDGIGLTRKIRAHPPTANLPVILTTGHLDEEVSRRSEEAGADDVLSKPFKLAALFEAIRRGLAFRTTP